MFLLISYLSKFFTILGAINWYSIIKGIKAYKSISIQKLLNKGDILILNGISKLIIIKKINTSVLIIEYTNSVYLSYLIYCKR